MAVVVVVVGWKEPIGDTEISLINCIKIIFVCKCVKGFCEFFHCIKDLLKIHQYLGANHFSCIYSELTINLVATEVLYTSKNCKKTTQMGCEKVVPADSLSPLVSPSEVRVMLSS